MLNCCLLYLSFSIKFNFNCGSFLPLYLLLLLAVKLLFKSDYNSCFNGKVWLLMKTLFFKSSFFCQFFVIFSVSFCQFFVSFFCETRSFLSVWKSIFMCGVWSSNLCQFFQIFCHFFQIFDTFSKVKENLW
jgi:hypothetical protein